MGVALFKDGGWTVFHEDTFTDRLAEGWSLSDEIMVLLDNSLPKCSTAGYGIGSGPTAAEWLAYDERMKPSVIHVKHGAKLSNKQIRTAAKNAGITDYAKARIKRLRKAMAL